MGNVVAIKAPLRLRCSSCGITQDAKCDCGAPYVAAGVLARQAVVEFPEKSNRAIADELGIHHSTVAEARRSTVGNPTVEKRIGRDGKARRTPQPKAERLPRFEPSSPHEDFYNPDEADERIRTIAKYAWGSLNNPPPGIRACLKDAMKRASPEHIRLITLAADFLTELKEAAHERSNA